MSTPPSGRPAIGVLPVVVEVRKATDLDAQPQRPVHGAESNIVDRSDRSRPHARRHPGRDTDERMNRSRPLPSTPAGTIGTLAPPPIDVMSAHALADTLAGDEPGATRTSRLIGVDTPEQACPGVTADAPPSIVGGVPAHAPLELHHVHPNRTSRGICLRRTAPLVGLFGT